MRNNYEKNEEEEQELRRELERLKQEKQDTENFDAQLIAKLVLEAQEMVLVKNWGRIGGEKNK